MTAVASRSTLEEAAPPRRVRPTLTGTQRTLVIPLYAKALDARSRHPILGDSKADEIVRSMDFDFESVLRSRNPRILVARARHLDDWVRAFLRQHPEATVLNVGCGLDPRVARIDPPSTALWIDLDFPEVIALRRHFFAETPRRLLVEGSLPDGPWWERVPRDRPLLAVADGVLPYLAPDDLRAFFSRVSTHAPTGEVMFDAMSSAAIARANRSLDPTLGVKLRWAVDELSDVDALEPRLHRREALPLLCSPYLPFSFRLLVKLFTTSPRRRGTLQLLRYDF